MDRTYVVGDELDARARSTPDAVFVECGGHRRTFAQMRERAELIAGTLAALGVRANDRVATILPNRIEHVDLIFGCARLGAVHVPTNVFLKGEFLRYQLHDAGASVVFADAEGAAAVAAVRDELPDLAHIVDLDATTELPSRDPPDVDLTAGDPMAIIYTSGTTGMPKGCVLPHGYHVKAALTSKEMLDYRVGDVLLTALPLFHGWARGMLGAALVHGLSLVLETEFVASNTVQRWRETGATVFSGVGAMGMALLAQPPSEADRDHGLRVAFMIPFPPDQQVAFMERFGVGVQSQMYGQTETGAISFSRLAEEGKPGTVGRPSPAYEVRILDEHDREVATGEPGEVVVRPRVPDTTYSGYWRKPPEEAWRGGWHHTGDIARFDDDGYLTFVDRKSDALRRRGENVSSAQLEAAILAHPKIAEAAVVAVPSPVTEDDIKACVVLADDRATTPAELFEHFRETLPFFAVPRYVEVLDALPKTATMRVQKHILRSAGVTSSTWDLEALGFSVSRSQRR